MSGLALGRRTDRAAVLIGMAGITAVAWSLTARFATSMVMPSMDAVPAMPLPGRQFLLVLAMWAAMMVGMMVPSATPMVVAYADWTHRGPAGGNRSAGTTAFLSGYLVIWLGFSLVAAVMQLALERAGLLTAMGAASRPGLGGAVLVLAGVFQLTPWKASCLHRCRTPLGFLVAEWRDGVRGSLVMGLRHGAYCLGCCWALMMVLFVVGTMHLPWMAAIGGFVLVEKAAPRGVGLRYVAAAALVGWGALVLVRAGV